ncbi:hypothetical protein O181_032096 [Austropuccinia psidii MF-1]|uniref:Uncharacterized protein n=1 Tax=Austropuccinia psidii MF-1 TaxID=1389203 RepID=A0A9Q3D1R8_9BASI|nr:hypothetical protein [Austropuccinia psidii MF-1]
MQTKSYLQQINHSINVKESLDALQSQIGPLTAENNLPLVLFFLAPKLQEQLTTAFNTPKASNPSIDIFSNNILDIANWIQSKDVPESSLSLQISAMEGQKHDRNHPKGRYFTSRSQLKINSPRPPMFPQSIHQQFMDWKKWLTSRNTCFHFGGVGHWSPNFPSKKAQSKLENHLSIETIGVVPAL